MTSLLARLAVLVAAMYAVDCITQTRTLIWTVKETSNGVVHIKGIPGNPRDWVRRGITQYSMSYFTDEYSRNRSHRLALGFRYAYQDLSFSDRGFKNIYRIHLQKAPHVPYQYYVPMYLVYTGISTQVNGMAVDWLSGSIYWTDALYNWVTVARLDTRNIFNHIVTTELDRPMGIAVYPQNGSLYWSDLGAVAKIERSRLDGTSRTVFITDDLDKPLGLSVDYVVRRLYWVDDFRKTIESVDLVTGTVRRRLYVTPDVASHPKLFALSVYEDYIFASEQSGMTIMIYNKTSSTFIRHQNAAIFDNTSAIPYDITMYDRSVQEDVDSDCNRLRCSHICISDGGQRAHCICSTGYQLINKTRCFRSTVIEKPMYVYSVGQRLCGTHVRITDYTVQMAPALVRCFHSLPAGRISSLAFHVHADLLYFADATGRRIYRVRMETIGDHRQLIASNTGTVGGLAVDWIADNLYWTDEDRGYIVMSRLDGRYRRVLIDGLTRPRSINVNPLTGLMYWMHSNDTIMVANLDGTRQREFLRVDGGQFDGMVVDVRRKRIYWVDSALPGIRSVREDSTDHREMLHADNQTFRDVTVYQNQFAWTNGDRAIYFGRKGGINEHIITVKRGIIHTDQQTSHDVITYDEYLQPSLDVNSTVLDLCDIDNDAVGCQQLCVLVPGDQRQCVCAVGFRLGADQRSCISDELDDNFLLFVDPVMKTMYQVDLTLSGSGPQQVHGIDIRTTNSPDRIAYDSTSRDFYWHDNDYGGLNSIKRMSLSSDVDEHTLTVLSRGREVGNMEAVPTAGLIVYNEVMSRTLRVLDPKSQTVSTTQLAAAVNVVSSAFAVDDRTGELYWTESVWHPVNVAQSIYTCHLSNCSSRARAQHVISWYRRDTIVGLHVAIDCDWNITFWTSTAIYGVTITVNETTIEQLFGGRESRGGRRSFNNITNAVAVDNRIFFTDWQSNSVLLTSRDQEVSALSDPVFSRLTDLKAYRSKDWPPKPLMSPQLSADALGGIIASGAAILLLLVLCAMILAVVLRRRRVQKATYKSAAHDNPTYMSHADINANLPAAGSPVDLVFDTDGAAGALYYADDEEKKIPLDDDMPGTEAVADDPTWCSQYDEKVDDKIKLHDNDYEEDKSPETEPPPEQPDLPQYTYVSLGATHM